MPRPPTMSIQDSIDLLQLALDEQKTLFAAMIVLLTRIAVAVEKKP